MFLILIIAGIVVVFAIICFAKYYFKLLDKDIYIKVFEIRFSKTKGINITTEVKDYDMTKGEFYCMILTFFIGGNCVILCRNFFTAICCDL